MFSHNSDASFIPSSSSELPGLRPRISNLPAKNTTMLTTAYELLGCGVVRAKSFLSATPYLLGATPYLLCWT